MRQIMVLDGDPVAPWGRSRPLAESDDAACRRVRTVATARQAPAGET